MLVHYEPDKRVVIAVAASPYGLGAVISHVFDDDTERPIAYALLTLSAAERNCT